MDDSIKYVDKNKILNYFDHLNKKDINYIIRNNINAEIPDRLKIAKDIDLLVKREDMEAFDSIMEASGFDKGVYDDNRNFLYGLTDSFMYQNTKDKAGFRVHVFHQLSCKGLLPFWVPLDKEIQQYAWNNKVWKEENQWWELDKNTSFTYMVVRCIFDRKIFLPKYITDIEKLFPLIDEDIVREFFHKIVVGYAERLFCLLKEKKYDAIVEDYVSFSDY